MSNEWQPIETYPGDGSRVLITGDEDSPKEVLIGLHEKDRDGSGEFYVTGYRIWYPSHWMPLPEPPK